MRAVYRSANVGPTPTPVDTTPIVIQGDGWVTTEAGIARLATFAENTHQLVYTEPVTVLVSDDVGAEYAPRFEAFESGEWWLLQALGLADSEVDRDVTNQVRRDRIRGIDRRCPVVRHVCISGPRLA